MKHLFFAATIVAMLASCKVQQADEADLQQVSPVATAPAGASVKEPEPELAPPVDGAFRSPLPEGVVLVQPHYARMDVAVTNNNGATGRRTEFEYLEGDAGQAMQAFATAMNAAGFTSEEGPLSEGDVIRQVFKKSGYGAVFARAQPLDPARKVHDSAKGFVVVAWPSTRTAQ